VAVNSPLLGRTLGRYRLDEVLGRGGMAEVFRATDTQLGREVAVKVVLSEFALDDELRERFLREARLAASLDHPHILPVYDFGDEEGVPFLVMPRISGGTLAERLVGRPLPIAWTVACLGQLSGALDAAHAAGVLHRDVKPGNVLIDEHGRALLADFGIAKLHASTTRLTRTGTVVGTPTYMAPEVAAGETAGAAADRYALAVMAYEMLAGKPPFAGENPLSILHQHTTSPVPPISRRAEHLPPAVDGVLAEALAKEPEVRPSSCRAFAEALALELGVPDALHRATVPSVPSPDGPTVPIASHGSRAPGGSVAMAARSRPWGRWLMAAALLAAAGLATFVALRPGETPERPPALEPNPGIAAEPEPDAAEPDAAEPDPAGLEAVKEDTAEPETSLETAPPESPPPPQRPIVSRLREETSNRAAFSRGFLELYTLRRRARPDDFDRGLERLQELGSGLPAAANEFVTHFAEGGRAYVAGDRDEAEEKLRQLLGATRGNAFWGAGPWLLLEEGGRTLPAFEAWQVDLGYLDPLDEARGRVESALTAEPEDGRLLLALAVGARLDGETAAVGKSSSEAYRRLLAAGDDADLIAFAARLAAEANGSAGDVREALAWSRRALEAGGEHRGMTAFQLAHMARQLGQLDATRKFLEVACESGVRRACERPGPRRRRSGSGN